MKVKQESEKAGLKLNIQKTEIMVSGSITSRQKDGETMKTVTDFILGGSKITADGDYSHEIKRCLCLARKAMTNLDSILKSRSTTLPTKVSIVKAMVCPIVMYQSESWTSQFSSIQFSRSVMSDFFHPMKCSTPGLPVHHQLLESTQTHVH